MGMQQNQSQVQNIKSNNGSKGLSVIEGLITGGPAGAAAGLMKASGIGGGSAIGNLIGKKSNGNDDNSSDVDAINRKMAEIDDQNANDPHNIINNGVDALDHPDVPSHIVMQAAPILLGVQHFGGYHPAMDQYMNQEQENG